VSRFFRIAVTVQIILVVVATMLLMESLRSNQERYVQSERAFVAVNTAQLYRSTLESAVLLVENAASRFAAAPELVLMGGSRMNELFSRIEERLDFVTGIAFVDSDGTVRVSSRPAGGFVVGRSVADRAFFRSTISMPLGGTFVGDPVVLDATTGESAHFVVSGPIYATDRIPSDGPIGVIALRIDPGYLESVVYRSEYANAFEVFLVDGNQRVLSQYPHRSDAVGTYCPPCATDESIIIRDVPSISLALRYDDSRLPPLLTSGRRVSLTLIGSFIFLVVVLESYLWRSLMKANRSQNAILSERTLLLREIHHRVYNNLQILSSLLSLQVAGEAAPSSDLESAVGRIDAMARVHRMLHESAALDRIDFSSFLRDIVDDTRQIAPGGVLLSTEGLDNPHPIPLDRAIPLGLIVHEILANAALHAFPSTPENAPHSPRIDVSFRTSNTDSSALLTIHDNGCGMDTDRDGRPGTARRGLGLLLVETLSKQAEVQIDCTSGRGLDGVRWSVEIPESRQAPRPSDQAR
jgi:two-component sensor histidine kinase